MKNKNSTSMLINMRTKKLIKNSPQTKKKILSSGRVGKTRKGLGACIKSWRPVTLPTCSTDVTHVFRDTEIVNIIGVNLRKAAPV